MRGVGRQDGTAAGTTAAASRRAPRLTPGVRRAAGLLAGLALLAGCGSTPAESPPTGVDGLRVPTPEPDPSDFVAEVDHPLFPLAEGGAWRYRAADGSEVAVEVVGGDVVAGVDVTVLDRVTTDADGEVVGERRSAYAEDAAGNVWSFGRQVLSGPGESWRAGVDGAEAGLLVPAAPRVGDAWLQQESPDLTTRVEVLETDAVVDGPDGDAAGTLVTEDTERTDAGEESVVRSYAPGLGVVQVADAGTGAVLLELVERTG